jgi:hypothetical protein
MQRGRARGRISVRRAQMKLLENGSGTMGVWLGKQILGQRDVVTNEHIGSSGGPIQLAIKPDLSRLSDEDVSKLRELARKTLPVVPEQFDTDPAARNKTSEVNPQ